MGKRRIAAATLILLTLVAGCDGGAAEPGADASAAPEPVVAPEDFFAAGPAQVAAEAPGATDLDPAQASLLGPHSCFAIDRVATATTIESPAAAQLQVGAPTAVPPLPEPSPEAEAAVQPGWRAADGYEFLMLQTGRLDDAYLVRLLDPEDAEIEVTIEAGDHTYELDPESVYADTFEDEAATLVMSVAQGADVELVLTDSGQTQSLDLRTGERRDQDAPPLLYTVLGGGLDGVFVAKVQPAGLRINMKPAEFEGELRGVGLRAYLPELGWAEPGRAWLRVNIDYEAWTFDDPAVYSSITFDTAASFTLAEPGGATIQAEPDELLLLDSRRHPDIQQDLTGGPVVFDVPEDLRSGTLTFAPQGTISTAVGDGTVSPVTSPDPMEFELTEGPR